MKNILIITLLAIVMVSCGSSKRSTSRNVSVIKNERPTQAKMKIERKDAEKPIIEPGEDIGKSESEKVKDNIIDFAKTFEGTRYKFGGTTSAGMDCSGLVYTAFKEENIELPRISRDMANKGVLVSLKDVEEGDLIFFKTNPRKTSINHVGLVVKSKRGELLFIHSTIQAGVIISSLEEPYWKNAFVQARRII